VREAARSGPWLPSEKERFFIRLQELQGNDNSSPGEWGIFSQGIPGRTGYQCKHFYRELLRTGELSSSDDREPPPLPVPDVPLPIFAIPLDLLRFRPSQSADEARPHHSLLEPPPPERFENPFRPGEPPSLDLVVNLGPPRLRRMSIAEKIQIIELRHAGKSFDYIAHQLERSQSSGSRFYDVWDSS
jgi:hypothetical protein